MKSLTRDNAPLPIRPHLPYAKRSSGRPEATVKMNAIPARSANLERIRESCDSKEQRWGRTRVWRGQHRFQARPRLQGPAAPPLQPPAGTRRRRRTSHPRHGPPGLRAGQCRRSGGMTHSSLLVVTPFDAAVPELVSFRTTVGPAVQKTPRARRHLLTTGDAVVLYYLQTRSRQEAGLFYFERNQY